MRIMLLADVHANWAALRAIDEEFDVCLCMGDLVEYGLEPTPCIEWAREHARYVVRGNHDHGLAQDVPIQAKSGYKYLTGATRALSRELVDKDDLRYLARLPVTRMVTLDDTRFLMVHATPRDPLDEYAPADEEFWQRRLQNVDADVICVGHTHLQYVLPVGEQLVVNPGSVGQPRDGDPRLGYAMVEGRKVELKRVEYPIDDTVRSVEQSTLPDVAKRQLIDVYRNGGSGQNGKKT